MASPALRRTAWIGAAVVAVGVIGGLAFYGRRPDPGLVQFRAGGVMLRIPPERVTEVEVAEGGRRWRFTRADAGEWVAALGSPRASGDFARQLDRGLRFLNVSAPERVILREEVSGTPLAEFGLDPPRYTVSVYAASLEPFAVEFGGPNPQGLAQYARVLGRDEIVLLPRYVGLEWEGVMGTR